MNDKTTVIPVTFLESEEANCFLAGLTPMIPGPLLNADSSNHEGTSCWACQSQSKDAMKTYNHTPSRQILLFFFNV